MEDLPVGSFPRRPRIGENLSERIDVGPVLSGPDEDDFHARPSADIRGGFGEPLGVVRPRELARPYVEDQESPLLDPQA